MLGGAIAGPGGAIFAKILASEFGTSPDENAIGEKILNSDGTLNAEVTIRLKEIESANANSLREYTLSLAKIDNENTISARNREVAINQSGGRNYIQPILATVGVVGFFATTGYVLAYGLGSMSQEASFVVGNMTGMVSALAKDIYGYYFGSSRSSDVKTNIMAGMEGRK